MHFLDGANFPENQPKLVITCAPYGPEWMPSDFPEDIAVTMEQQIQKAVDCYNAGATVLHLHVRELDGKGSKRLSKFNELIAWMEKMTRECGSSARTYKSGLIWCVSSKAIRTIGARQRCSDDWQWQPD